LDRVILEDGDRPGVVYDRDYEISEYGENIVLLAEQIHQNMISNMDAPLGMTNKKNYLGVTMNGIAINYFIVHLYKKYVEVRVYVEERDDCTNYMISARGDRKGKYYSFIIHTYDEYSERSEDIKSIAKIAYKKRTK